MNKQSVFYFITSMCNKRCPYCFVSHKDDYMTIEDIDNALLNLPKNIYAENIIYGGEPTLHPDVVRYLVDELKKLNRNNITLYSNGYNLPLLHELDSKGVQIYINYDAYDNDLKFINNYDWVFTIAPSTLFYTLNAYKQFRSNNKYLNFRLMHYYNKDAIFWDDNSIRSLSGILDYLIYLYKTTLLNSNENYMPYFIKDTLQRLISRSSGEELKHRCHTNITFLPGKNTSSCYLCNSKEYKDICSSCSLKDICAYNTPCYLDIPKDKQKYLCKIQEMLFDKVIYLNSELKDNIYWQSVILSICKEDFNGDM